MGRSRKQRRNAHGSAWHWKQTDCWYYTLPGTKKRVSLFDDNGERIRGPEQRALAERALARIKLAGELGGTVSTTDQEWIVARVCSERQDWNADGVYSDGPLAEKRMLPVLYVKPTAGHEEELLIHIINYR